MTAQELLKQGGSWLGAARSWIQWNCGPAGSSCTWGSDYNLGTLTPRKVEEIAAAAVAAYINAQECKATSPVKVYDKGTCGRASGTFREAKGHLELHKKKANCHSWYAIIL